MAPRAHKCGNCGVISFSTDNGALVPMTKFPSGCEDGGHPWVTASIRHFYLGAMRANILLERAKIRSLARHWHVWRREIVAAAAAASVAPMWGGRHGGGYQGA